MNIRNLFKNNSASTAKNRLKVILTSERSQVPEKVIDAVTREFAEILEKYFEINKYGQNCIEVLRILNDINT